jgi:hypothetical protein
MIEIGKCSHCESAIVNRGRGWVHLKSNMAQCSVSAKSASVAEPGKGSNDAR